MILWERIKMLREAKNVSQTQLADALNVSKQSVSNWENNNILPSIECLERLSDYFGVSTDYLLGREERRYLDVTMLNQSEAAHIQTIINDIARYRKLKQHGDND